jgi:hypothetical protein
VLLRGVTVLTVTAGVLWLTRFFNAEELRSLNSLRRRRQHAAPITTATEATGMAGEIVTVEVPDEIVAGPKRGEHR